MRYSTEHKQQTRDKLLASSGALAKRGGFASTGVAGLMKAIGLTGGAFYNHFPSKDDLFTEVVRQELCNSPLARLAEQGADRERLQRCLQQYLSLAHLHNAEGGCPLPPLGVEIARAQQPVREEAEHWLVQLHAAWSQTLNDEALAWVLISQCVGALVVGRMLASEQVQGELLHASQQFVCRALNEAD
ncbi:TetR/AcrR family transcriptional regulator [Pseudomonas sp. PSKL.D1]|uniref:TetR/AcrR family transcriptional regulator n=1 Tax=Pseudomonas sp. PSKL.D1 TaxID=3029060 RepID=UPI0023814BFE|nr:TetR/AcrR family transcriptional regulator [Pseudomonas sp. PSKL.D1]WDY55948.1 TetR/AcrR family transcriptional regulator [Pseudomonas sp. PSKL.D1]